MNGNFPAVEINQLRYFIAAAERGSFRKAAAALGIQESSISRRVRDLEDELGASLFHRYNGGVSLTQAGQQFLRRARGALKQIEHGSKDVAAVGRGEDGHIKVGIFSSLAAGFLSDLLFVFKADHPGVHIELIEGNPSEHIAAIRQLRMDVAFLTGTTQWPDCETEHLWTERVFAVLPRDHPLAGKRKLDWSDLTGHRFIVSDGAPGPEIYDYLVQGMASLGHHPEIKPQYVGRDCLLSFVAIDRNLTLTSEASTAMRLPRIVYRPLINELLPFSAVWCPQNDNPACQRLRSLARSMARSKTMANISV